MVSQILIVMIAAIAVSIFAERRDIQPPLLLALVGLAASFVPGLPRLELEPHVILSVVLPPLLFSAATEFSLVSFFRRLGSITNLGVFLVLVTTFIVGGLGALIIPGMTLGAAIVMAAVVSPPDAVTAVAIGRKLGLPGRLMTLLKGESLINDAAALTLFTFAGAAVTGTRLFISNGVLFFFYGAIVGVIIGILIGALVHQARLRMKNASLITVLSLLVPFTAYLVAEELGASGVLAVVFAGFSLGHNSSEAGFEARIQERQFWRTADALLEAFVFAYIGLQMRFVLDDVAAAGLEVWQIIGLSLVVLLAVIVVRFGWVFATAALFRWQRGRVIRQQAEIAAGTRPPRRQMRGPRQRGGQFEIPEPFSWKENLVIGWTGMRGVVTLAAAAGIPLTTVTGAPFPGRDVIQLVAFVVTIGTLLLQGLTLPWLIARLGISDPAETAFLKSQHKLAGKISFEASRATLIAWRDAQTDPANRALADQMLLRFSASGTDEGERRGGSQMGEVGRLIMEAQRTALIKARDERRLDDEVLREVLADLDLQQAVMTTWNTGRSG